MLTPNSHAQIRDTRALSRKPIVDLDQQKEILRKCLRTHHLWGDEPTKDITTIVTPHSRRRDSSLHSVNIKLTAVIFVIENSV